MVTAALEFSVYYLHYPCSNSVTAQVYFNSVHLKSLFKVCVAVFIIDNTHTYNIGGGVKNFAWRFSRNVPFQLSNEVSVRRNILEMFIVQ